MSGQDKATFFPAGLLMILQRAKRTLVDDHDPVEAESLLDVAFSRVRDWGVAFDYKVELQKALEKALAEVQYGTPATAEHYIDEALDQLQPKTKDAKTHTKNPAAAGAGRGQGREGKGPSKSSFVWTGAEGGAGAVAEAPFKFKANKRSQTDGGLRPLSNGANADAGAEMVSLVSDASELDNDTKLTDALTNLLHWCDRERVVFDVALRMARMHHAAER